MASPVKLGLPAPLLLAMLYAGLIVIGAATLALPVSSIDGLSLSDALFMATSAVTVTGLSVVDIGSHLTVFGQLVMLILVQLGGIGLMTFAVLILSSLGLPVGLPQKTFLQEDLARTSLTQLLELVRLIVRVFLVAEVLGAALLTIAFVPDHGWTHGVWLAVFHAISAFNNAGFSLFPDSLVGYALNPIVNSVIPLLFIVGGLGFAVLFDISSVLRRTHPAWHLLSLHTRIMLVGTTCLIAASVVGVSALEWHNPDTLGAYTTAAERMTVGWFQATTTRTAGFNTTDVALLNESTSLLVIVLMIIGGGTTSTAGGIKVTTVFVLLLATVAFLQRRDHLQAFGRSIGLDQVLKAMALLTMSLFALLTALFILLIDHELPFLALLFEAASAFGTVGLSRGVTGELDALGRAVICVLMFLGRVGPLSLGFCLALSVQRRVRYPQGEIHLG